MKIDSDMFNQLKESLPKNVFDSEGNIHTGAMVDALEEVNFRLSAFARAYLGKEHSMGAVLSRARVLQDNLGDFATMLMVYCNHHENPEKKELHINGQSNEVV